jgi:hypothetical protein
MLMPTLASKTHSNFNLGNKIVKEIAGLLFSIFRHMKKMHQRREREETLTKDQRE